MTNRKAAAIVARMTGAIENALSWAAPYTFGGENPRLGLDCSGFVAYVLGRGGYPGTVRQTADWYAENVFTQTSAPSALGGYAEMFCAFCYWNSALSKYDHIALPLSPALCAEATMAPLSGVLMEDVSSIDIDEVFVTGPTEYGLGVQEFERFKGICRTWYALYLYANGPEDSYDLDVGQFDFSGDYSGVYSNGDLVFNATTIAKMLSWGCSANAMICLLSSITGTDRLYTKTLMTYAAAGLVTNVNYKGVNVTVGSDIIPPLHWIIYKVLTLVWDSTFTAFRLDRFWDVAQSFMMSPGRPGSLMSGVRVFDRAKFAANTNFQKRYMSAAMLDTFLESDGEEETSNGRIQSVPTRRV